ncbi:MAG: PAS domain S-box protein [Deltaproteobacteria bacterium]|nr:PAS domain S-box protein [Candidatus Zymogenaceae bacterium]
MKKARSIRSDIFILIVIIAFVPLAVYFLFDILSLTKELKRNVHKSYIDLIVHYSKDLNIFLTDRIVDLKLLSQSPAFKSPNATHDEKISEIYKVQDYYHYFSDITLMSLDGTAVLSTTYSFFSDLSKTRWFLEATEGRSVITDPYRDLSGIDLKIRFFVPVVDNEKVVSILSARMNMEKIWEVSDTVRFGETGYILIVDQFGNIVSNPNRSMIFEKFPGLPTGEIPIDGVKSFSVEFADRDGIEYVGSAVVMDKNPLFEMAPLFIVAIQQKNEAYSLSHYVLIRDLLEMIAVLSLIILVSIYISARMTQPIQTIIDGTARIAEGNLGTTIDVKSWKEINRIAEAFNMMSRNLLTYTKELKSSEERYRTLVEDINDGFYLVQDNTIVYANDAAFEMMGYERGEVIGKIIYDFIPKEDWGRIASNYRDIMNTNTIPDKIEIPIIKKNGEVIYIEAQPKIVSMDEKDLIAGIFIDISARRKREEVLNEDRKFLEREVKKKSRELFESEQKYRTIVESAADGIFLCELNGAVISANKSMTEILGVSPVGMDCRQFFERIFPASAETDSTDITRLIPAPDQTTYTNTSITVDKRGTLNLDIKMNAIDLGKGTRFIQGVVRDTTQRKALEIAVENSKQRLQAAFDAVSDRMYMIDSDYVIKFVNRSVAEELSLPYTDILERKCYSFLNTKNEPCAGCPLGLVMTDHVGITDEVMVSDKDGTRFYRVSIYPVVPASFSHDYLVHSRHITEEKKIQEHLIQSDRLISLGQLSAGVAHEINNPLTSILGYTQILLQEKTKKSEDYDDLKIIEEQALNCKTILNDLLLFSRTRVDKKEFFSVNEVLDGVILINQKQMKDKKIVLKRKFSKNLSPFYGNQIKLTQVFLNIIKNAIDAVDKKGKIIIATSYDEKTKRIEVAIEDNGHGIDRDNMDKIFDPFFTTKPPGQGTGLGLSVSYGIIVEHDGAIYARSEPGKRTIFTIMLPSSLHDNP